MVQNLSWEADSRSVSH